MKALAISSLFLFLSFLPGISKAQKDVIRQQLIWYGYFITVPIDSNWSVIAEIQERHFVHPFAQHQLSLRGHIRRKLGKSGWEASGGFAAFFQSPNNPRSELELIEPELRVHTELVSRQRLNKLTLEHRYRAEARFFRNLNAEETELEEGYSFGSFRFRYRILLSFPIWQINDNKVLKVIAGDELMAQAGKKINYVFDQNRVIAGFNFTFSRALTVEMSYQKWINQRQSGGHYNRDIVRLVANHRLAPGKSKN